MVRKRRFSPPARNCSDGDKNGTGSGHTDAVELLADQLVSVAVSFPVVEATAGAASAMAAAVVTLVATVCAVDETKIGTCRLSA